MRGWTMAQIIPIGPTRARRLAEKQAKVSDDLSWYMAQVLYADPGKKTQLVEFLARLFGPRPA